MLCSVANWHLSYTSSGWSCRRWQRRQQSMTPTQPESAPTSQRWTCCTCSARRLPSRSSIRSSSSSSASSRSSSTRTVRTTWSHHSPAMGQSPSPLMRTRTCLTVQQVRALHALAPLQRVACQCRLRANGMLTMLLLQQALATSGAAMQLLHCCCCCSRPAVVSLLLLTYCCCPAAVALLLFTCCCCPAALLLLLPCCC
jgi:hypothetical protein